MTLIDAEKLEKKIEKDFKHKKITRYDRELLLYYLDIEMLIVANALMNEHNDCENCAIAIEDRQPVIRCKECINCVEEPNGELYCDILAVGYEPLGSKKVNADWFCADGERKETRK